MSSDILTQLQTCYDQLLTQFFSTISYLSQRHPLVAPEPIPGDPFTNPPEISTADSTGQDATKQSGLQVGPEDTERSIYPLRPASPSTFANAQKELAEDLVRKGQQIEYLISKLPGIGIGEAKQAEEIQILVQQVREMDRIREQKRREMRACVQKLDNVVLGMSKSMGNGNSPHLQPESSRIQYSV